MRSNNSIHVLPPSVADKIAAGEVAERPSSVVKELVENAVDAGANKITVEIKNGGVKLIRVTDNGCGIPRDQVKTAFLRHATSKLSSEDDLYSISTMGFRGEALSSICAVARVEVITKTEDDEVGAHYVVDHGVCGDADEIACADGTIMSVEDLFANIPARMKFLKKDSTEAGYVSDLMTRLALSKPDISFEYICDGKQMFNTSGDGELKNVILKVYGLKIAKAVMPVDYTEDGVRITGVVGKPEISFGNRTKQTVFVNGRYIKNHVISKIAEEAFRNSMMVGRFPFFVLDIIMPPELVDVNVHPAKTEVKFANEKGLYDIIYHAVKSAMYGKMPAEPAVKGNASEYKPRKAETDKRYGVLNDSRQLDSNIVKDYLEYTKPPVKPENGGVFNKLAEELWNINREPQSGESDKSAEREQSPEFKAKPPVANEGVQAEFSDISDISDISEDEENSGRSIFDNCRIVGQVFDTYIIVSSNDTMFMIDQHAAHERAGFEELKQAYLKNERMSQVLLVPIVVDLSHSEYDAVMSNIDVFKRFGFEIEEFGTNTVIINETPIIAEDEEIKSLLCEILDAVIQNIKHPIADFEEKALDMISCKKAIKGNDKLSLPEMTHVLELVKELYSKGITTCPHGRPIVTEFTKKEIEKMFKRIV